MIQTDVCIIGAGPGGSVTALFLAKKGISCVLVDKTKFPRDKICGDALSGKSVEILRKLDEEIIDELNLSPIQTGSWGVKFVAPNLKHIRIPFKKDFNKQQRPPGFIAKRIDFDNFLIEKVKQNSSIQLLEETEIKNFIPENDGWILSDESGEKTIHTKLVIAADGAHSAFAKQIGKIQVEQSHYCAGIRAYYKGVTEMDKDNFIELHFIKEFLPGYFWIFPLPNGMANVGVGMRSDFVSRKKVNLKKQMLEMIEHYPSLKKRFQHAKLEGEIKGFGLPLGSKKRKISGERFMLIGDAASLIDPFTGEGIGNAMMSGMIAAEVAEKSLNENGFSAASMSVYDEKVYKRLWSELRLSKQMQELVKYPWLFNMVVNKANKSKLLQETITCMFEDMDMREQLSKPSFYFKLLFTNS